MGIFIPTKLEGDIVIYSKWCVQCYWPDELIQINQYALTNDLDVQVIRTAYRPADHRKAVELWGSHGPVEGHEAEDYPTFVLYGDKIYRLMEFLEMIGDDTKNKLVKEGKTKDDVQRLRPTKRAKRENRVDVETDDTAAEDEEQKEE